MGEELKSEKTIKHTPSADGVYFWKRTNETQYENLYNDLTLFLSKLPQSPAKKYVTETLNRGLIYMAITDITKQGKLFSKYGIDNGKLNAIFLDIKELEISNDGISKNIDSCIYATYFSFIRAAIKIFNTKVRVDRKLHDVLIEYFYIILLQTLPIRLQDNLQKNVFRYIVHYIYYKQFIDENHHYIFKIIRDKFATTEKESFDFFSEKANLLKSYDSVKDVLKIMMDMGIYTGITNPNQFIIDMLKKYKQYGFLCLNSTLDHFVGMIILSKYPFEFFETVPSNRKLQDGIETYMVNNYLKKVGFSTQSLRS